MSPSVECYVSVPPAEELCGHKCPMPLPLGGALEYLVGACHVAGETLAQASWRYL